MKSLFALTLTAIAIMMSTPQSLFAETIYVTDDWKFEMRERPCAKCKILIYNLPSGTPLEKTGATEGIWVELRTESGKTGWMPKNYLSSLPAARKELESAEKNASKAILEAELAKTQLHLVTRELQGAGIEIEVVDVTAKDGVTSIQAPKIIGNLAALGRQNSDLRERLQLLENDLDMRVAEIDRLTDNEKQQFFGYGVMAILAGALLAVLLPRIPRKKSHSEWA